MPEDSFPLKEQDFNNLEQGLKDLRTVDGIVSRMKVAGLDTKEVEEQLKEVRTKATKMKQAFWPGR